MKKSILTFGTILLAVIGVNAQSDTTKPAATSNTTTYTTYIDGYYRSDFEGLQSNNKTSFTNSNSAFQLGMVSVKADKTLGKFAGTIDLGFGKRADEFSYNDKDFATSLKQAYVSFAPNSVLKFTVGKWATHIGYELLDAYSNRNYSMSYGFSYGPFFHTGLRADVSLGGKSAFMVGVAEPTDYFNSKVEPKMAIAQFSTGTSDDKVKLFLNYQGGMSKSQFDVVLNAAISNEFGFNYDATVCNISGKNWSSNAVYLNYDFNSIFGLAARSEYFNDSKGALGLGTAIFQNTLSANIHFNKFTIIPEIRVEDGTNRPFLSKSLAEKATAGSFLIAAVYKF